MNIYIHPDNNKRLIIEGADNSIILGKGFRNFAGEERRDRNTGRIVNTSGNRNFNLRIPEEYLEFFQNLNCRIKEYGGNPEEGEPPLRYVKVNVNINSNIPPSLRWINSNGEVANTDLPVDQYKNIDTAFISYANLSIGLFVSPADGMTSLYLNVGRFKQYVDPVTEMWDSKMMDEGVEPNINDEI
jgi:hypothetical protein